MIQENSRIENINGYRFYEQDILFDDYMFSNDIQLTVDLDYVSPGFGIALVDHEGYSIKEKGFSYLFKIGYKEASIYYSTKESKTLIKQLSIKEAYTIQENMKFTFIKQGKKIIIKINDSVILSEYINKSLDKYNLGYYSNVGNTINSISIASALPDRWTVNMNNTQGGYIKFYNNSFEIRNCKNDAEIEQSKIKLKPGKYYLKFDKEDVDGIFNISNYVNIYNDDGLFDDEKNILNEKDNSFFLMSESEVNLKFIGKQGMIKNILISENQEDNFIPTIDNNFTFEGSYIDIFLSDIKNVKWKGQVDRTPGLLTSKEIFALIMDSKTIIKPQDTPILFKKEYEFEFIKDDYIFNIYEGKKNIYSSQLRNINNKITIFKNITGIISSLVLTKKSGEQINVNLQDEYKKYINASITSPIIVVDKYNNPLDLSSSYRLSHYKDYQKYIFTNHEREFFKAQKKLILEKSIINKMDSVIIYGIYKGTNYDLDKIYDIYEDNINSIDMMADVYDTLYEKDVLLIDKIKNIIYMKPEQIEKYEIIIVDYLKDDSYCINYHYDKHIYEVNISSMNKENKTIYDTKVISNKDKVITQIRDYKITDINGNINGYVVLRKGVN